MHLGGVVSAATLRPVNPHFNRKEDALFKYQLRVAPRVKLLVPRIILNNSRGFLFVIP